MKSWFIASGKDSTALELREVPVSEPKAGELLARVRERGTVDLEYREYDAASQPVGGWTRLEPFQNKYDTQAYDFFFNCMFDPVDDGNTEDDFFDPTDPERRLGPSSTCHPLFTYSCMGDTDEPFTVDHLCNATVPPGPSDAGSLGTGTWIQSKVDLEPLEGRRIKLRFLASAIKATAETHEALFESVNPGDYDNGWWIDDVTIDTTLANPATLVVDDHILHHCTANPSIGCLNAQDCTDSGFPGACQGEAPQCGPTCTSITAVVSTTPDDNGGALTETLVAPGQPITHRHQRDARAGPRGRDDVVSAGVADPRQRVVLAEDGERRPRPGLEARAERGLDAAHPGLDLEAVPGEELTDPAAGAPLLEGQLGMRVDA